MVNPADRDTAIRRSRFAEPEVALLRGKLFVVNIPRQDIPSNPGALDIALTTADKPVRVYRTRYATGREPLRATWYEGGSFTGGTAVTPRNRDFTSSETPPFTAIEFGPGGVYTPGTELVAITLDLTNEELIGALTNVGSILEPGQTYGLRIENLDGTGTLRVALAFEAAAAEDL